MAATDHTRLRTARAGARDKSTDNRRETPSGTPPRTTPAPTRPPLPALPPDARTTPPTHPRWTLPVALHTAVLPTAPPTAWEQPLAGRQSSDTAEAEAIEHDPHEDIDAPWVFGPEELRCAARTISDIHGALALAYAYALTFQRAVRAFIPVDELDILPCLTTGVLDILDTQLPRLDALLDHLACCAAHVPAARAVPQSGPHRHSRRSHEADFAETPFGDSAAGSAP
jgi:hypothetical protein